MNNTYEVIKDKDSKDITCSERIIINDNAYTFPLMETGLVIIESLPFLEGLLHNSNSNVFDFYKYSKSTEIDVYSLFYVFAKNIDIQEINRLKTIKRYLELCAINPINNDYKNLNTLVLNLYEDKKTIIKLLSLNASIRNKFTYFESLSELVVISLFETLDMGYKIYRCEFCSRFFIAHNSNRNKKLCERKFSLNNDLGCKDYKVYINKISREENPCIQQYKKICSKLRKRADRKESEKSNFEYFREEWKKLFQQTKSMDEIERNNLLSSFLNQERFR